MAVRPAPNYINWIQLAPYPHLMPWRQIPAPLINSSFQSSFYWQALTYCQAHGHHPIILIKFLNQLLLWEHLSKQNHKPNSTTTFSTLSYESLATPFIAERRLAETVQPNCSR